MNAGTAQKEAPRAEQAPGGMKEHRNAIIGPPAAQVREAAKDYLWRGWHPIPIAPPEAEKKESGKAPTLKGWQTHYTALDEIERFWPDGTRNNIGISLGPSRHVVLDFDEAAAYHAWKAKHPAAAQSYTVARDNAEPGRCHVYFTLGEEQTAPAQMTKKATGWGDLKSVGGQVVAPPSVHHSGGLYVVLNDTEPLPWLDEYTPEWGPGLPEQPKPKATAPTPRPPVSNAPGIPPSVEAALQSGAPEGSRNCAAFECAIQLRDEGHAEAAALAILAPFAGRCAPPLSERELAAAVQSAYRGTPREPARNPSKPPYEHRAGSVTMVTPDAAPEEWPEPEPLGALSGTPPPWPWEVYPAPLRDIGREITETMRVPDELPGLALLCAASIAARKIAAVEIKPGHRQYANLYAMAAMPAATGKSPALRPIQAPLIAAQIDMRTVHRDTMREWKARAKVARAQSKALERRAEKGEGNPEEIAAEIARLEAVETERPPEPVLIADNATSEAAARIMSGNGGSLGIMSSDARDILSIAQGRYSNGEDISVWLKGHAADYLAYHRSNPEKPPFEVFEPCLAAFLAVQPDALLALGQSRPLRDSGFLARWLFVVPECTPGDYPEQSISHSAQRAYADTVRAILNIPPAENEEGVPAPHVCRLDDAAFTAWKQFHDTTKREAHTAAPLLAQCWGKLPEHTARIAGVFHLAGYAAATIGGHRAGYAGGAQKKIGVPHTNTGGTGTMPGPIGADTMQRAITLADVLKAHLRRAVELLGETGERAKARELLPAIWRTRATLRERRRAEGLGELCAVKPRDVVRAGWAGIQDTDEARAALALLDIKGWVRLRTIGRYGTRGHELYELHPRAIP